MGMIPTFPQDFQSGSGVFATDQVTVLEGIVKQITQNVTALGSYVNCFVSDDPEPSEEIQDNLFCTVTVYGGAFDDAPFVGGGPYGVNEASRFLVTIWSRIETDMQERSYNAATDADRGLLVLKKQVLKALAGQQLYDAQGNPILLEAIRPIQSLNPPGRSASGDFSSLGIVFEAQFSWDLS